MKRTRLLTLVFCFCLIPRLLTADETDEQTLRVFIFAGQSNMAGSDSKVADIRNFPPFQGLEQPQTQVKFTYCIGRENKLRSDGWVALQPVNNVVGPELSFARRVSQNVKAPLAIIKVAAGGTHLGGDWNPDDPSGFKMYPLALQTIRDALAELREQKIAYRLEGFMWHQGENDMFNEDYMRNYGDNLANLVAKWRRDLMVPNLKFYIGELCTKTIWGMDLRPRMYAISQGQRTVTNMDPLCEYVPTSHVGVEIGGGVGLHYHYGTLGQLEHGVNYAEAYLRTIGQAAEPTKPLESWPYPKGAKVKLFVLAGHRNMEGERAFVQTLRKLPHDKALAEPNVNIAFKYSVGGGFQQSNDWEPLRPAGPYDNFGPELSFGATLAEQLDAPVAIAKFTHSGTQIIDWTPKGSVAKTRNLYPQFTAFVKSAIEQLEARGHKVELAGIFYHVGENDMSFTPHRRQAPQWIKAFIDQSRVDLMRPNLRWYVSQQPPTDNERVNGIDVMAAMKKFADTDENVVHIPVTDFPKQEKQLVLDTPGIVYLGKVLAETYLQDE